MNTVISRLHTQLQAEADQAERLAQQGQVEAATYLFQRVLEQAPDYSIAQNFMAMRAYANGDLAKARHWIDTAVLGQPRLALIEANRALILLAQGDPITALSALEAALELDPEFAPARLDAGQLHEAAGRRHEANRHYRLAIEKLPPPAHLPAPLRERVERAQRSLSIEHQELAALLEQQLAPLRAKLDAGEGDRFEECLDILMGRKRVQASKPGFMHFPKLAPLSFFPREMFSWASTVEAATGQIRDELLAVMAEHDARFMPYIQKVASEAGPDSPWNQLNFNRDWGVYFLFNQGDRVEANCAACPATTALLESLPLVRIPGRGPTAFFSRLQPNTHIPAHHCATNTRLIAHLPLVVPPDCVLRVGNDIRQWQPGELLVFDDTIEHEAWNHSEQVRVVLIFDVWNPFLSAGERELVTAVTRAMAELYPERLHDTNAQSKENE